jgi:hypothetical protein
MKRIIALPFFCLLVLAVSAGCVARVGYVAPQPVYVAQQPVYVAPAAEPVAVVESPGMGQIGEVPPPIDIAEPELVVVPSGNEYVYMVPNVAGVYFYGGGWYRYYGGSWFSASVWGGPWVGIGVAPGVVVGIDPFYPFYLPAGYFRIGWGDFHSHWRSWGHDHHWHNNAHFKREMRSDVRQARMSRINADRRTGNISKFDRTGKVAGQRGQTFKSQQGMRGQQGLKGQQTLRGQQGQQGLKQRSNIKPQTKTLSKPQGKPQSHGGQQGGQHERGQR